MNDAISATLVVATLLLVATTAAFLWRCVMSKTMKPLLSARYDGMPRAEKAHAAAVLLGWIAFVVAGILGLLRLLPMLSSDVRWGVAVVGALLSIGALPSFDALPGLRRQALEDGQLLAWLESLPNNSTERLQWEVDQLATASRDFGRPLPERFLAERKHQFAARLVRRYETIEASVLERQRRENAEQVAQAQRQRQEAEKHAAAQKQAAEIAAFVAARVQALDSVVDVSSVAEGQEALLADAPTTQIWELLKSKVTAAQPASESEVENAQARLTENLATLQDVVAPEGCRVLIRMQGNERDGHCDAFAVANGMEAPLAQVLRYRSTNAGLVTAFFLQAALMRQWSWGHGMYDRDHQLIVTLEHLRNVLAEAPGKARASAQGAWPPPGVRARGLANGFRVCCLSVRPGRGVFDLSVDVLDDVASDLQIRDVFVWGQGVFY